jgi:hypothetical protein
MTLYSATTFLGKDESRSCSGARLAQKRAYRAQTNAKAAEKQKKLHEEAIHKPYKT